LLLALLSLVALSLLTWNIVADVGLARLDPRVQGLVVRHRTEWLTEAFRGLTWLGSTVVLGPLVGLAGAIFLVRGRHVLPAILPAAALIATVLAKNGVKALIERPRPLPTLAIGSTGFAFPSGHAADSVAVFAMLALILATGQSSHARWAIWGGAALVALVVGASRVYLGAHWLTDVLGGWALAGAIVSILAAVLGPGRRSGPEAEALTPPAGPAGT
jgi:membrane-associated phospholipid phosphatase